MAYDNNFIQEDVLFTKKPEEVKEVVSTPAVEEFESEDFGSEVLFSTPKSSEGGVIEEILFDVDETESPVETLLMENDDVVEESLFGGAPAVEELTVVEEDLEFAEPIAPTTISEEQLFTAKEEAPVQEVDNTQTVLSDELTALASDGGDLAVVAVEKPKYIEKNFAQKFIESDEEILKRYDELKNIILKYKGVKSRVSNDFDSFNMGRTQLFKLGFSTQSLKLYLNLDINEVESRLKCKDVSHKKAYAQVPVFLRIKSPRAMRNAKYLINQVAEKFNLKENPKATYVDSIEVLKSKAKSY